MRKYCGVILDRINTAIPPQYHRNTTAILLNLTQRLIEDPVEGIKIYRIQKKQKLVRHKQLKR